MAKNKKKKEIEKKFKYGEEIIGFIILLAVIIGFCNYGPVGKLINGFGIFLFGAWYTLFLCGMLVISVFMLLKRNKPDYFNIRLIGLYFIIVSILILSHLDYVKEFGGANFDMIKETVDNFMISIKNPDNASGGGIIGALLSVLFVFLFTANGTLIVCLAIILFGIIMLFDISIIDLIKGLFSKIKAIFTKNKNKVDKNKIEEKEVKYDEDKKIVVSSVSELLSHNEEEEEKNKEDNIIEEEDNNINTGYKLPPMILLKDVKKVKNNSSGEEIKKTIDILEKVLEDFSLVGKVVEVHQGPTVTQYELELKRGTKVNKILSINREIALALSAKNVIIQAPIPGKSTIGIEIPNMTTAMVGLKEILVSVPSSQKQSKLLVALGKDIMGKPIFMEINKTPHLLVAGSTGSGKSVCVNGIITSILMRATPSEVKLLMIDPKKVELTMYNGIPHLLAPVVTDPKKASIALQKIVVEMENRYDMFEQSKTKNIAGYNEYVEQKNKSLSDEDKLKKLPFIVVLVDELADLMLVASKEVEDSIMRITQMARAAGIHLIIATQRPSTDVITGVIKANIPSRISFAVSSQIDSRTILDKAGAEKLLGKGDMLFLPMGESMPIRLQGNYVSEEEIIKIVDFTIEQQKAKYDSSMLELDKKQVENKIEKEEYDDPLYNEIVDFIVHSGKVSASLLQRKYRLGYNRAARIIDLLEERGIIGPQNGSKPREVLVSLEGEQVDD